MRVVPSPSTHTPKSGQERYLHKITEEHEHRSVRFLLSPPPEDTMVGGKGKVEKQIFVPREAPTDVGDKLKSSKHWGRKELDLFEVIFEENPPRLLDLNTITNPNGIEWTSDLRARVEEGERQLRAVEMMDLQTISVNIDSLQTSAPVFDPFYSKLLSLMEIQEDKKLAKEALLARTQSKEKAASVNSQSQQVTSTSSTSMSTSTRSKRPPPDPVSTDGPSKRTRSDDDPRRASVELPTTPDQPTIPTDPKLSGLSIESQDEEATKKMIYEFLSCTLRVLQLPFRKISWHRSSAKLVQLTMSDKDDIRIKLGYDTVRAINDGGLVIQYNCGRTFTSFGKRPVLSLEAKRRHSKHKNDPKLLWCYAGQIFCEMLAQICHREYFEHNLRGYQETFVIHGHHSSITIYYCKFPNLYLADISRLGRKWKDSELRTYNRRRLKAPRVRLHRTKRFSLRDTDQRVECFLVIARLISYLTSGSSHVGYLHNYDENPLHRIGSQGEILLENIEMIVESKEEDDEDDDEYSGNESVISDDSSGQNVDVGNLTDAIVDAEELAEQEGEFMSEIE